MNIHRIQIGKWRFSYSFGRYGLGLRREAKRAGSFALLFTVVTYMKVGRYERLSQGAWFSR